MIRAVARLALVLAAFGLLVAAAFHIAALFVDPAFTAFLGAPPQFVQSLRDGAWHAAVSILGIAGVLGALAACALAGAGALPRPPFLRWVLGLAGALFIARGLIVVPILASGRVNWSAPFDLFHVAASMVILAIGVAFALGAWRAPWRTRTDRPGA